MGYAEGNLCMVAYTNRAGDRDAVPLCQNALTHMEAAAQRMHNSPDILADVANRHAWLADAYYTAGRKSECIAHRRMQESILAELMRADPKNMDIKDSWIALQRILAWLEANAGEKPAALARLRRARTISSELVAFDPSNQSWLHQKIAVSSDIARLLQEHRQNPKRKGTHEQRATLARF
jgi:hypothetical protein